ncbi:MAG: deoxyguanosinetriphosphate triphosphohydrolase, partial [Gammaproteobacteria bacterium]|nr:deoxyguanosinetriphosphate triphosphohydrolase [Gammaproteobacteria bacterium]
MTELAGYAASESSSRGRRYPEPAPAHRSQYQRDRDRIIHSAAFRRLEYKTQVFVNHEGDMFRTRLTHSIEVAQIGRTIARALQLNEDLTEAICLAHDLGHTPFGHAGQDELNRCMQEHGGFEHNLQSLRVVDVLEKKYPEFPGLNLMFETREGILKHCSRKHAAQLGDVGERFLQGLQPGLEAQIANIADEIAYNNHDTDDGLRSGLLTLEQLLECELFATHHVNICKQYPQLDEKQIGHEIVRRMINSLVSDLIEHSEESIRALAPGSIDDVRKAGKVLIHQGERMAGQHLQLKQFLRKNLYAHERVKEMTDRARLTVKT